MSTAAILILATAVCGLLTSMIGVVMSFRNRATINKIEVSIDGRLSELLALTKKSSHAEGVIEGQALPPTQEKS